MKTVILITLSFVTLITISVGCSGSTSTQRIISLEDCSFQISSGIDSKKEAIDLALKYLETWHTKGFYKDSSVILDDKVYYHDYFKTYTDGIAPEIVSVSIRKTNGCAHPRGLD
jgi:hypothetical protein